MILTPTVLQKLDEVPLEVSLWNGNFNKCTVERVINRRYYRIDVVDAHPLVREFVIESVVKEPVRVLYNSWMVNCNGAPIPEELLPLIDRMKEVTKMQEEQAVKIRAEMLNSLQEFRENFLL